MKNNSACMGHNLKRIFEQVPKIEMKILPPILSLFDGNLCLIFRPSGQLGNSNWLQWIGNMSSALSVFWHDSYLKKLRNQLKENEFFNLTANFNPPIEKQYGLSREDSWDYCFLKIPDIFAERGLSEGKNQYLPIPSLDRLYLITISIHWNTIWWLEMRI